VKLWEQLASEMKELEDAAKQQVLFRNTSKVQRPDVVIKEMCDVLYTLHQLALAFGIDLDEAFRRVHEANMSKTDDEGYPIKDDNGKIQKGPNYKSPDLTGTF
jgi:predicted HAD superfamily Cof-like phosphohydrolase